MYFSQGKGSARGEKGGMVFSLFWSETGIHFAHFGLQSGVVFEGITGVCERIYRFNSKWIS